MSKNNRMLIIMITVIFIIVSAVVILFAFHQSNQGKKRDSTTQQTAPPYEGSPIVSFEDQTGDELLNTAGNSDYINIKYFIGEYLVTKGVPKNPIPRVTISNFKTDLIYLGTIGLYNNVYSFDAYSHDLNTTLQVQVSTITSGDTPTTATIVNDNFSKPLQSYDYEKF